MSWWIITVFIIAIVALIILFYYTKIIPLMFKMDENVPTSSPFKKLINKLTIVYAGLTIFCLFLFYLDLCYSEITKTCMSPSLAYLGQKLGAQLAPNLVAGGFEAGLLGLVFTITWYYVEKNLEKPVNGKSIVGSDITLIELKNENYKILEKLSSIENNVKKLSDKIKISEKEKKLKKITKI